jgi:hypothetical protein
MITKQIRYCDVEGIIESRLIVYRGKIYLTVEDMQTFPDPVTLITYGTEEEC